jgi:thiamine pyridinylase
MTSSNLKLRVAIFPYIPDLAGDKLAGLKKYIADEFNKITGHQVLVDTVADPYNLKLLKSTYLTDDESAYDIMELDTVLLGEVVECLQPLDNFVCSVTPDVYSSSAVQSVWYSTHLEKHLYGIPTLQCASFLMELADLNHAPRKSLLKDWSTFDKLKEALDKEEEESGHRPLLCGDFRRIWGLPMFCLDEYVDEHGNKTMCEGIDAPVDDAELIKELKEFIDYGRLPDGMNPDTDGGFHEHHDKLVERAVKSKHVLMYTYSENMGETITKAARQMKPKRPLGIASPPLDHSNNLLTYTDAVVVNKAKYADHRKTELINYFLDFYTSLEFRFSYAFGGDLDQPVCPRYVLPARRDFFTVDKVTKDEYYMQFHKALQCHSVSAPNNGIYVKRKVRQKQLEKALGMTQGPHAQLA